MPAARIDVGDTIRGGGSGNFGIATMPRVKSDSKYSTLFGGILQLVGVQNFKFSGYMTVSGLCMHDFGKFVMILENFLLFTEISTENMLQRQIYVQNIQYDVLLRKEGGS